MKNFSLRLFGFLLTFLMIFFPFLQVFSQEKIQETQTASPELSTVQGIKSAKSVLSKGTILYSFPLNQTRDAQGVTVVNDTIIIASSDGAGNNYFDTYDFAGNHYREVAQATKSKWGYRDLAYDGQYILASDDTTIKKISPVDFTVVSSINNSGNNPNRGLAYDANEHVIYSSNYKRHILKIDPATGATLKTLNRPLENVYGLAIDTYSNPAYASLWFTEPSKHGVYRLSRADTTNININYVVDLTEATPDSAYSGGLEIINNHPDYPSRIIALMTDQYNKKLNFVDITDSPYSLPADLEVVGKFGGADASGIITSGMVQYDKYLYSVDNGKLVIYEIDTDPVNPTFIKSVDVPNGNRIFLEGNFGDHIIVSTKKAGVYGFAAFRLSDPLNPQFLSQTQTTYPIISMDVGSFSYVVEEGSDSLFVYYMGTYENPYIQAKYKLIGEGVSLVTDPSNHLLFVGYKGDISHCGVQVFDNNNPNKLTEKSHKTLNGDFPKKLITLTSVKKLIVAKNQSKGNASFLHCYDYSDPADLSFTALTIVSLSHAIWDMILFSNNLYVSVPDEGKLLTYRWDDYSRLFLKGSELAGLEAPIDIIGYAYSAPSGKIKNAGMITKSNYEKYVYVPNGYATGTTVAGSEKTDVVKAKQPPVTTKATLIMSIMPPEASQHGCSVTPSPGAHEYTKGTAINVYAHPNPNDGWYFTGWTGDASGTDLIRHLIMDEDKNVTGHFDELLLTVSGKKDLRSYCPNEITKNPHVFHLPITVAASTVDDWELQKISLRSKGSGDEQKDISGVEVYLGTTKRYSGKFSADNGELAVSFTPPISIGAGESVTLNLYYNFGFDPKTYVTDTTKSFYVETFGTVAKPVHYDEGKIAGNAVRDSLTFARVYNTQGYGFSTIQDAVDAETTRNGDSCIVCAGNYHRSVKIGASVGIPKSLVIIAKEGPDNTRVSLNSWSWSVFNLSGAYNCEVNGFGFEGGDTAIKVYGGKMNRIIGNKILESYIGIYSGFSDSTKIMNNTIISAKKRFIKLNSVRHSDIANNYFSNANGKKVIETNSGYGNLIHGNNCDHYLSIILNNEKHSYVYNNNCSLSSRSAKISCEDCKAISASYNKNLNILLINTSSADIIRNDLSTIFIGGRARDILIRNNYINDNNNEGGIHVNVLNSVGRGDLEITGNKITHTDLPIEIIGINDVIIMNNEICFNGAGVYVLNVKRFIFDKNTVRETDGAGLELYNVNRGSVVGNLFSNNKSGIIDRSSKNIWFCGNKIVNNQGSNTGLHVYHSDISVTGNHISGNSGGGIKLDESSRADISYNNIYSNKEVQVENKDDTLSSDVSNNYWGNPTGPANGDMTGNLTMTGFLKDTVRVVLSAVSDTTHVTAGSEDSVDVFMNNFVNPADHLLVSLKDEKGWVQSMAKDTFNLDSLGVVFPIKFKVPANTGDSIFDLVTVSCHSMYDTSFAASDTFVLASYVPKILHFSIDPDSSTLHFGDSVHFSVFGSDQYGNAITVSPAWTASGGTISTDGLFTSDSTEGIIEICASIPDKKMTTITKVYNTHQDIYLDKVVIRPDSVKMLPGGEKTFSSEGYNQFGFPNSIEKVWSATGGTISSTGHYKADLVPGTYHIVVQDIDSTQSDTAVVIIENVTGVEQTHAVSSGLNLSQNYPNPFQNKTQISFTLSRPANVWLSILDINGREVARLLKTRKPAGTYRLTYDATRLPAGIYFYRLQAGNSVQIRKMIHLK